MYHDHLQSIKDNIVAEFPNVDPDSITIEGPHMADWMSPITITSTICGVRVVGYYTTTYASLTVNRHGGQTYSFNFQPHNHYLTREAASLLYIVMVVWAKAC